MINIFKKLGILEYVNNKEDTNYNKLFHNNYENNINNNDPLMVIDLRNNYGGVIQDSMLLSSLFLENKDSVICYTVSSRGPMG